MDVTNLCRSCMVEIAAWETEEADQNTLEMFSFCTNIEILPEDKLPKHFCYNCIVLLESSYAYIRTARRINGKLKKIVQNGCTNFVDDFLSKANSENQIVFREKSNQDSDAKLEKYVEPCIEKIPEENITVNNIDHLFDDDDDRCLSEFKSENFENDVKEEVKEEIEDNKMDISVPEELNNTVANPSNDIKPLTCNICMKEFSSDGWYARHMKLGHSGKDPKKKKKSWKKNKTKKVYEETKDTGDPTCEIRCRVCDKIFRSKQVRTKHLNEEHSRTENGNRVYLCPYCPKTFTKYSHMYYHTTSHPDLVKHPCKTCGKAYRIRKELQQHMRTHQLDRPYACDKCDMRFKVKGILATHLKWHDGIRPHLCSICGRSFLQSGNLLSHMRVHTGERPFACSFCSFRSTSRVSLTRHELRHKGERPFPCAHCPKRFFESCSLNRHLRSHTRERPYRCPYCSRDFFDSGKRRRHFIMTHKMTAEEIPPMDKSGATIERTAQNSARIRSHPWQMSS